MTQQRSRTHRLRVAAIVAATCAVVLTFAPAGGADVAIDSPVQQIAAGRDHTCAILESGWVVCWGSNRHNMLNLGDEPRSARPVGIDINNATHVDASSTNTCVIDTDGLLSCWGLLLNYNGDQFLEEEAEAPTLVSGPVDVIDVAPGSGFVCAAEASGQILCWGRNANGELGRGGAPTDQNYEPGPVVGISTAVAVDTSDHRACALLEDGSATCWGGGDADPYPTGLTDVSAIAVTADAVCGVDAARNIDCWSFDDESTSSYDVGGAEQLSGDWDEWCTTTTNGLLFCAEDEGDPAETMNFSDFVAVAVGDHTCAARATGTVICWGGAADGEMGGYLDRSLDPVAPVGLGVVDMIGVGNEHACALTEGDVYCWGRNLYGQLGRGNIVDSNVPVLADVEDVVWLEVGGDHTCVVLADTTVRCWGYNLQEQTGVLSGTTQKDPVEVSGLTDVVQLTASNHHTCALLENSNGKCWGWWVLGQLGDGTGSTNPTPEFGWGKPNPVDVISITDLVQIEAGRAHTCFLRDDGLVFCRGENDIGQLGTGDDLRWLVGPQVTHLTDAVDLAVGGDRACALRGDGVVRCWGDKSTGPGSASFGRVSAAIDLHAPAVQIDVSPGHACAALADGSAACWGGNVSGVFGIDTIERASEPVIVPNLGEASTFDLGPSTACGIFDGEARCWGSDEYGQLGRGVVDHVEVPSYRSNAYFLDVSPWAFYGEATAWLSVEEITLGIAPALYGPDDLVTRAQMAAFLWRYAGEPDPTGPAPMFDDVAPTAWYATAVHWLYGEEITLGTTATTYSPSDFLTRSQMAAFLWRMSGRPTPTGPAPEFTDVQSGSFYEVAVHWLFDEGITLGTTETTFGPGELLSRAQMAAFLWRMAGEPAVE